jgi:hypothetical protein
MGNRWRRWRYKGSDLPDEETAHHETVAHITAAHVTARSHSEPAVNSSATSTAAAGNSHSSNSNGHAHTSGSSGKQPWRVRLEKKLQVTRQLQVLEHTAFYSQLHIVTALVCARITA